MFVSDGIWTHKRSDLAKILQNPTACNIFQAAWKPWFYAYKSPKICIISCPNTTISALIPAKLRGGS